MSATLKTSGVCGGFSLVEVTVAIGIFAFVAVGILGLLPTALKIRSESAQETRAVLIAEELFTAIAVSGGLTNVVVRDGPAGEARNNSSVDLTKDKILVGYPSQTTVPFGLWSSRRGLDPQRLWESGELPGWAVDNGIQTLAYLYASDAQPVTNSVPGCRAYRVTCEIRSPASLPLAKSKPTIFTTFVAAPDP